MRHRTTHSILASVLTACILTPHVQDAAAKLTIPPGEQDHPWTRCILGSYSRAVALVARFQLNFDSTRKPSLSCDVG